MRRAAHALVACAVATPAAADDGGTEHWFASAGGTFGAAVHAAGTGGVAGGELSIVHVRTRDPWPRHDDPSCNHCSSALSPDLPHVRDWIGGYVDAVYDSMPHRARLTLGPELGRGNFGLDGGIAIQPSGSRVGAALRGVATLGVIAVYVRGERYFDGASDASVLEVGALLKLPHAL